ncbi:MAG: DUF368 domain-containing protein [Spirochaetia bacterium]
MGQPNFQPILNALKGSLIGAANTIPGVSGGTIAVITGLYDRLIEAVSEFFKTGWKRNITFLVPVTFGVAVGILLFARAVSFFMETYPAQTAYFFMGLVLGSMPFLIGLALRERFKWIYLIPFSVALALLIYMGVAGRPPMSEPITELTPSGAILIFLTGTIASATMIIPGVSGSLVMLMIGLYSTFIHAVDELNLPILAVAAPGFVIGIVIVSKLINSLLSRFHALTYWTIIGLVLGSVVAIWPKTDAGAWFFPTGAMDIGSGIGALIVGFLPAFFLGSRRRSDDA